MDVFSVAVDIVVDDDFGDGVSMFVSRLGHDSLSIFLIGRRGCSVVTLPSLNGALQKPTKIYNQIIQRKCNDTFI